MCKGAERAAEPVVPVVVVPVLDVVAAEDLDLSEGRILLPLAWCELNTG